ncbi:hypothetical protein, partial [Pseudomonas viridiflava]|uniref:hypothetical protein n=1 Tax=Pseudomonas viridiflava TaxID=33069 RepID=UPI0019809BB7
LLAQFVGRDEVGDLRRVAFGANFLAVLFDVPRDRDASAAGASLLPDESWATAGVMRVSSTAPETSG